MTREHAPSLLESERSSESGRVECLGRMLPDVVGLPGGAADLGILQIVIEEETRLRHPLPIDSMIALVLLRHERRLDTSRLGREIQRDETAARKVLERLVEAGMVEAHGVREGRTYTLSPKVSKALGQPADYVRKPGSTRFSRSKWSFNW